MKKTKIDNEVNLELQDKTIERYLILRKSNVKDKLIVWGTYFTIGEVIDNLKKINTDYSADYIIEKQVIKFENVALFDYEHKIIKEMIDEINNNLLIQGKPELVIGRSKKNIIKTDQN